MLHSGGISVTILDGVTTQRHQLTETAIAVDEQ
jgi:hypothetical protein